ncbi:isopeptide-forming domain-containing fimbrial protein [Bifidobacterium criceti]|uniref:FimA fimbrial subunit-like protein n=1 Tax=Bifidobacterium criceti TaxID=1960969 RepID=A0A2A2EGS6_9BIFI|nr:isopeptide-forming domain-containing fimbrial protein [Bifidobacterium criceti]PAU68108.1 FimA fimbrial subunit-like protein [Bifidobacterium criceti]
MKKVWKGFAAAVSAAAIAATGFIGATSAYADDPVTDEDGNVTVTVNGATSAQDKFNAYRILDVTNSGSNYTYTIAVDNTGSGKYLQVLRDATGLPLNGTQAQNNTAINNYIRYGTATPETDASGNITATEIQSDSTAMKQFADALWVAINSQKNAEGKTEAVAPDKQFVGGQLITPAEGETPAVLGAQFTGPQGYYLIRQTDAANTNDTLSGLILNTAGQNGVQVSMKKDVPTVEKQIKDVNDTSGATNWGDAADHDVNDPIEYKLTGTTANNVNDYHKYQFKFTDTMSAGLTFVKADQTIAKSDVVVKVDGVQLAENAYTVSLTDVATNTAAPYTGGTVLTVDIADLKTANYLDADGNLVTDDKGNAKVIALNGGDKVTVEYRATLNEDAKIGVQGNPNKVQLSFAKDPHFNGTGEQPTGETPEDTVIAFTYEVNANKVQGDGTTPLAGASFALLKKFKTGDSFVWKAYQPAAAATDDSPKVYAGWVSINLPQGVTLPDDIATLQQNVAQHITPSIATVLEDGKYVAKFPRIDDGDYALVETVVPAGYNYVAPKTFTVTQGITRNPATAVPDGTTNTGIWTDPTVTGMTVNGGTISTNIVNKSGSQLPSTGGMGTTVLYVAGAAIVLIAGIGLAVALRRRQA